MTRHSGKDTIGATPGKLALIAILAVVLGIVMVNNFRGGSATASAPRDKTENDVADVDKNSTPTKEMSDTEESARPWPQVSVEIAKANDPFRKPAWMAKPSIEDVAVDQRADPEALTQLQEQGASIVVISGGTKTATIGERQVRVGDVIDGYRITDITTRGVVLQEIP